MNDELDISRAKFRIADNVQLIPGSREWAIYKLDAHDIIRISPEEGRAIQSGRLNDATIQQLIDAEILIENESHASQSTAVFTNACSSVVPFRMAWLELTNVCNLFCSHCYMNAVSKGKKSKVDWYAVLEYLAIHQCRHAVFIGGEPLCHPDFINYVEFAKKIAPTMRLCVVTNGTLWNENLLRRMKDLDVLLKFSLLGSSPERHDDATCVSGSFDAVIRNLDLAISIGARVEIATTIGLSSEETTENMRRFVVSRFGYIKHSMARVRPQGRQFPCVSSSDICSEKQLAVHISKKFFDLAMRVHPCLHGKAAFAYSGLVHPCIMSRFEKKDIETVLKQSPKDVFRQWWTLTKDKIDGCCDCALRYACFDCRGYATSMSDHPCNCNLAAELAVKGNR